MHMRLLAFLVFFLIGGALFSQIKQVPTANLNNRAGKTVEIQKDTTYLLKAEKKTKRV